MTENRNNTDFKAKYEFLIAGILVILLCLSAFTIYKITGYIKSGQALEGIGTSDENTDGTVLIEVEVRETRPDDGTDELGSELDGIWSSDGRAYGVVTSGNYRKYYVRDGRKYAHSIDPRKGYPVDHNLLSATVVSPAGAADADALATWCMVIGLEEAQALLTGLDGVEGYLIYTAEDGSMTEWATPGFRLAESK